MSRKIACLVLLCLCKLSNAQLDIDHQEFKINNLGQVLAVFDGGINLYSPKGVKLKHYSEDFLGEISQIDRSSSLESLIFY